MTTITLTETASTLQTAVNEMISLPPRYSSLPGCISESAAEQLRTINARALASNDPSNDIEFTERRPPGYSTVFHEFTPRASSETTRERRRAGNLSLQVGGPPSRRGSSESPSSAEDITLSSTSSRSGAPMQFEYHVKSGYAAGRSTPWANLQLFSRSSASPARGSSNGSARIPKYSSKDLVQGCLELNLENPQNINSISLAVIERETRNLIVRGRLVTSSFEGGVYTFYEHTIVNWTRADGDPRTTFSSPEAVGSPLPQSSPSSSSPTSPSSTTRISFSSPTGSRPGTPSGSIRTKRFDAKLFGSYLWPFSFPFPAEVTIPGLDSEGKAYPTPQTFNEKGVNAAVQYEVILKMTHGVLKADSKLNAPIAYAPDIHPGAPSVLRQLAYSQRSRIPGPLADPFGWTTLPPAIVRGRFFGAANGTKLQCSLSLANPLSYTRGTVIPLHLTIRSSDVNALSQLGVPQCVSVQLVRKVRYVDDPAQSISQVNKSGKQPTSILKTGREEVTVVEKAVWWVPPNGSGSNEVDERTMKILEGEIILASDLQPTCSFLLFNVSYEIEICCFDHPSFKPSSTTSSILLFNQVTIASRHGDGPRPIPVSEPPSDSRRQLQRERRDHRQRAREVNALRFMGNVEMFMGNERP
ncbi:hypothetical protein CPB83DRAFT_878940 [Crepidotus variabilis]|uniref:Arrestin-like N-terminal domain-containing protein n=1 Tax=Crepidotus variabilis TaxID=179855 RepID=A0A9P6JUQ9_9AGAR|nr:hypothetical protein CPB83DRAFT_878940 [Crepidotus variabilis]